LFPEDFSLKKFLCNIH